MPFSFSMAFPAASCVSKCTNPKPFDPFSSQTTFTERNALETGLMLYNKAEWGEHLLLYRIRWSRRRRRCHTDPRCRWISPGSWWRCSPRRSSSAKGLSVTTSDAWAFPAWGQSSWCPGLARLGPINTTVIQMSLWMNHVKCRWFLLIDSS